MGHKIFKGSKTKLRRRGAKRRKSAVPATRGRHVKQIGGAQNSATGISISESGGASVASDICSKTDINALLLGDFKVGRTGNLDSSIDDYAKSIKKDVSVVSNVAKGNWLAGPGPPPALPSCAIM